MEEGKRREGRWVERMGRKKGMGVGGMGWIAADGASYMTIHLSR